MGCSHREDSVRISLHIHIVRDWSSQTKAAASAHSGDWLNATPISSIALLLSDEDIRLSLAQQLGVKACSPYTCACGKSVDARGQHGLSCKRSMARRQRHSMVNDIILRAVKRAKDHAHKEPTGLVLQNGKRPDGATLIPWSRSKALALNVTIPDTYAMSHIQSTSVVSGSAAKHAVRMKTLKYQISRSERHSYLLSYRHWNCRILGRSSSGDDRRNWPTISTRNGWSEGNNVPLSEDLRRHSKRKRTNTFDTFNI